MCKTCCISWLFLLEDLVKEVICDEKCFIYYDHFFLRVGVLPKLRCASGVGHAAKQYTLIC